MHILNLIRWKNLLLIVATQLLIKYALFEPFGITITLNGFGFSLLILATVCIAAAGNIINDIYDVEADTINKPEKVIVGKSISENTASNLFIAFNVIGVALGFYLSHLVGKTGFFAIFVITSALLYIYATYLKGIMIVGNLVISALVALSIILVGIFDLLPVITENNQSTQLTMFKILLDYALFAFCINFIRELVKDIEDIDGDYKVGHNTLPIALGRERSSKLSFVLTIIVTLVITYYVVTYLYQQTLAVIYFLVLVIAPLIYVCIKLFLAENKKDFSHTSFILKLVMLTGLLSLALYPFILK